MPLEPETPVNPEAPIENTPIENPETFDPSDFNSSEEPRVQENKGYGGSEEGKTSKTLNKWLENDPELLNECKEWYKNKPEWWGIDPENTEVFYRNQNEVAEIRKMTGERGGHHPHGLALGGPQGQKLTPTGETRWVKNPTHSQVTGLQRKVINKIKNQ